MHNDLHARRCGTGAIGATLSQAAHSLGELIGRRCASWPCQAPSRPATASDGLNVRRTCSRGACAQLLDVCVGSASRYWTSRSQCVYWSSDGAPRDVAVVTAASSARITSWACSPACAMRETLSAYARLGVAAPGHRGTNLAYAGHGSSVEALGRLPGPGHTPRAWPRMKAPHAQRAFERAGWQLSGITPGLTARWSSPPAAPRERNQWPQGCSLP